MRKLLLCLLAVCPAFCQDGSEVNLSQSPPRLGITRVLSYDTNGYLRYTCITPSLRYSASTLTGATIVANGSSATITLASHGLRVGNPITITGSSVMGLSGTYAIATVPSTSTFTITTTASGTDSGGVVTTVAPRSSQGIWSIQRTVSDSTGKLLSVDWANGRPTAYSQICDNASTLQYQ